MNNRATQLSALVIAIAAACSGCNRDADNVDAKQQTHNHLELAESYRRQGQYRAAIIEARNALQKSPNDRAAKLNLARIFVELGQGKAALNLLEPIAADANRDEALAIAQSYFLQHKFQSCLDYIATNSARLQSDSDQATMLLKARAQMRLNQTSAAQETLAKLSATDVAVNLERERLARQQGDIATSKNLLDTLSAQHPENVDVLLETAAQAEAAGDLERAEDSLSRALMSLPATDVLTPQRVETLQRLITTLTKLGRSNEALVYSKTLADANPEGMALQDKLKQASEFLQTGKLDEAEPLLLEVYEESHNETVGSLLGMIRFTKNDLKGAANYLAPNVDPETTDDKTLTALAATQLELAQPNQLLQIFDERARARITNPELKVLVGIALLQTHQSAEGEKLVQEAQRAKPGSPSVASAVTRFYLQNKEPLKAIATLKALPTAETDPNLGRLLITAYLAAKDNVQALALAEKLTKSGADKAENWWTLGRTAFQIGDFNTAESALRKALQLQPDYATAQLDLAQLYQVRKQPDQAVKLYREVLARRPDALGALRGFVNALAAQGNDAGAIEQNVLAIADNTQSRTVLADFLLHQGRDDDARRLLDSLGNNTSSYVKQIRLAAVLKEATQALGERRFDQARNLVLTALQSDTRNPDLTIMLARIEYAAGKSDESKKIALQLATQQPQYPPTQELLGDLAMLEKQTAKATQHYQLAWDKTRGDAVGKKLYQSLALADQVAAAKFLQQWQQSNPESAMPYFIQGSQQQRAGDISAAITSYEAAISRNANSASALNNLAVLYQARGDARALTTAEQAYRLAPNDPAILDTYGWLLVQSKQREKGLPLLEQAAKLAPGAEEVLQHLKEALANPK
ncbi:MAG: tetratricopeptide repeat protein [Spongiibacteraceae bacterium]